MAQLASRQHAIGVAAIIADVRFPDNVGDAIEISLEHAEGQALRVLLPYARRRKAITYGQILASAGGGKSGRIPGHLRTLCIATQLDRRRRPGQGHGKVVN